MDENAELLTRIEMHCARAGIAETTFGRLSVNDGKLVGRLRAGTTITIRTFRTVENYLRDAEIGESLQHSTQSNVEAQA